MALCCSLLALLHVVTSRSKTRFRTPKGVLNLAKGLPWSQIGELSSNSSLTRKIIPGARAISVVGEIILANILHKISKFILKSLKKLRINIREIRMDLELFCLSTGNRDDF
jgi:hypothetical protein